MNKEQNPPSVIIIGGGTAGWLSALLFQSEAKRLGKPINLTLIESSKLPTIGVGEGTTAIFGSVLQALGIDEGQFLGETDATIKYGIRHRDWRRLGHYYDGPIDDPYLLADKVPGAGSWLDSYCVATGQSVTKPHLFAALMAGAKAPVAELNGRLVALSPYQHAYHFDQAKVGAFLRKNSTAIDVIDDVVEGAEQDESGFITSLKLASGQQLRGDFFVDCSGFRRALIGNVMKTPWVSYSHVLPVNRAMPFWLDHKDGEDIPTYTHAWAQKSGWMWQIPTQSRMGCGYVYSDNHTTPEQAQHEIETALGRQIEPRNDIKIEAGRLEEVWVKNVLAIGLAASFLEPLEATSIHGTIVSLLLFIKRHIADLGERNPQGRARYNKAIADQVDDFRDFINLHYVSNRDDSPFWQDVAASFIQPQTKERLKIWQNKMPDAGDFSNDLDGLPHLETVLHYPVLDGLGLLNQDIAKKTIDTKPHLKEFARQTTDHLAQQAQDLGCRALSHRAWLDRLANRF